MFKTITLSVLIGPLLFNPQTSNTVNSKEGNAFSNNALFQYFNLPELKLDNVLSNKIKFNNKVLNLLEDQKETNFNDFIYQLKEQHQQNPGQTVTQITPKPSKLVNPGSKTSITTTVPSQPSNPAPVKPEKPSEQVAEKPEESTLLSAFENKVVELTNVERSKAGLKSFKVNNKLSSVARTKSKDMTDKNYFDHNSPTYGSPFDMMKQFGISYKYAAENIAKGQKTPEEVVQAWMNSAGHRANILNGNLDQIGVGYNSRANTWTQMFISQ